MKTILIPIALTSTFALEVIKEKSHSSSMSHTYCTTDSDCFTGKCLPFTMGHRCAEIESGSQY